MWKSKHFFYYLLAIFISGAGLIIFLIFPILNKVQANANECANWQANHPEWVFCDDFELGNKDKWNQVAGKATVDGARTYSGNYSLHIPYEDLTPPPPATDINRFAQVDLKDLNLTHFFVRGYVNFASGGTYAEQRKLYYIFGKNWGTGVGWDVITSAWYRNTPFRHQVNSNGYSWSGLRVPGSDTKKDSVFNFDTWYALELEVKLNSSPTCDTAGTCDGLVRVWVNDTLQLERTNIKIRNNVEPLGNVRVGAQADDTNFIVNEHRYWDNVVVSRSRIGMYGSTPSPAPATSPASSATVGQATSSYNLGTMTLRNGSRSEAVKELQRFLNDTLNLGLKLDGILGPKTIAVIKKWQADNGLVSDGLVGPRTKARMLNN